MIPYEVEIIISIVKTGQEVVRFTYYAISDEDARGAAYQYIPQGQESEYSIYIYKKDRSELG